MKTFQQFILEANKHPIPADEYTKWQNDRDEGKVQQVKHLMV